MSVLRPCGCFDGSYSDGCPGVLVSVRCLEHRAVPAQVRHSLMYRDERGRPFCVTPKLAEKQRRDAAT